MGEAGQNELAPRPVLGTEPETLHMLSKGTTELQSQGHLYYVLILGCPLGANVGINREEMLSLMKGTDLELFSVMHTA